MPASPAPWPATFDAQHFPVDDQRLPWGVSLDEAERLLSPRPWLRAYGGWPNLRCRCHRVLGLPAVECNLRGPARHKPVVQASYELATPPGHTGPGPATPAYWVQPLTRVLGPPTQAGPNPSAFPGAGSVVYTTRWDGPRLSVGLSVFGGVRQGETGPTSAGLYLGWQDVLTAARPFYEAALAQSAALATSFGQLPAPPLVFDTQYRQGYYYSEASPAALSPADEIRWRQSHRALYREGLLETPAPLQSQLTATQVALWRVAAPAAWALSTTFDTVLLPDESTAAVEWLTLRPAKGGGAQQLSIGELTLSDAYDAPALPRLAQALERAGVPVQRTESYDC